MKLLHDLRHTGSTLVKKAKLRNIHFNEFRTFVYAYNPYLMYRMSFDAVNIFDLGEPSDAMFDTLNSILERNVSGNAAKRMVEEFAKTNGDLIKLVVNKDLGCGVSTVMFNAVHPAAIPVFNVQLAKEVPVKDVQLPKLAQIKYDGVRIIAINTDGNTRLFTRNGKNVNLPELINKLENLPFTNYILDGELVYNEGMQEGRSSISGAVNSAMHGGIVDETEMVFYVFDTMPLVQWHAGVCNVPYFRRFEKVNEIVPQEDSYIAVADTYEVTELLQLNELYDGAIAIGYEGLILKDAGHLYTFKRSKDWVKMKETKTVDLVCIGYEDGEGKYEGEIGSLVCQGFAEGKAITVKVGSGLSDYDRQRADIMYTGKVIEVKYNSVVLDSKTNTYSLFLPRFVKVRFDK